MTHLSSSELADYVEGTLPSGRAAHVARCERCRAQADAAAGALARASQADDVPEPSPLFWDHLSSRVRQAVAAERPERPRRFAWPWLRPLPLALTAGLATFLVLLAVHRAPSPAPPAAATDAAGSSSRAAAAVAAPGFAPDIAAGRDDAWDVLSDAASEVEIEEARAAGLAVRPGEIDRAVADLTPIERAALGRLLQQELKRAGA